MVLSDPLAIEDTSYSWSTNIVGRKRWRLFPPRVKCHLRSEPTPLLFGFPVLTGIVSEFHAISSSEVAPSVDEIQHLSSQGRLGAVKDGKAGWPEWYKAMEAMVEIEQEVSNEIFLYTGCCRPDEDEICSRGSTPRY